MRPASISALAWLEPLGPYGPRLPVPNCARQRDAIGWETAVLELHWTNPSLAPSNRRLRGKQKAERNRVDSRVKTPRAIRTAAHAPYSCRRSFQNLRR